MILIMTVVISQMKKTVQVSECQIYLASLAGPYYQTLDGYKNTWQVSSVNNLHSMLFFNIC